MAAAFAADLEAAPPPIIDGNIADLLAYVADGADCGLSITDAAQDVCKTDALIIPCVAEIACPAGGGTYFVNGFDFTTSAGAYDATNNVLYLGFRVVGQVGDANGDGSPGNVCAIPGANVADGAEVSLQEQYIWEIDTDCDGTPNITVEVRGDQVNVLGASPSSTDFDFNGTDLEVRVSGINLPAIWRLRPFVGSTTDGLSEDTAVPAQCPPPDLDLEIEKVAVPETICAGEETRFTITVSNTGAADLLVSLHDVLPVGLTFNNNVSGDFTFANQVGQEIHFNDLTIPAGESRDVSFDALAGETCFGALENLAVATGSFDEPCLPEPLAVGPVEDRATVTCGVEPCVQLDIDCPPASCEGQSILLSATVTNCSDGTENITVTIAGEDTTFLNVPADGERTWERWVIHGPCVEGGVNYAFSATASNGCGTSAPDTDQCRVLCQAPTIDVEITGPDQIPSGEEFCYTITVSNPGTVTLEDVEVCADICEFVTYADNATPTPDSEPNVGDANGTICWSFDTLAPGGEEVLTFCITAVGNCPEAVTCLTSVTAEGFCAEARDDDTDDVETLITCAGENCPRTPGFWTQQCAQKGNGSEKFDEDEVTEIAACVDNNSDFFDWADDFDEFCDVIDPERPMDQFKQLQRHFAALLANHCTGFLELEADNGATISLDLDTPIDCPGVDAETIGELIDEIDDALQSGDEDKYGALLECADGINNGVGIPLDSDCGEEEDEEESSGAEPLLELDAPAPNPFADITRADFTVGGDGQQVLISVYDVSGRKIRSLVNGFTAAGRHQLSWDGRTDDGVQVMRGVYFLRAYVAGQRIATSPRILYVR